MWALGVKLVRLLTQATPPHCSAGGAAQRGPPSLPHFCATAGGAAGWGGGGDGPQSTPCARPPATPSTWEKISRLRTRRAHTHARVPLARNASKQSVDEAFVLAITQPSVKTLITTVEQDDSQLWRGGRRFSYFYFLKSEAAVTTQEAPREGFVCARAFFFYLRKLNLISSEVSFGSPRRLFFEAHGVLWLQRA